MSRSGAKLDTLVYVAPEEGAGGVGDYAADMFSQLRGEFRSSVWVKTRGAGAESALNVQRIVRDVRRLLRQATRGSVLHFELSGGSLAPFWALPRVAVDSTVTATVHDAPYPVWWPLRFKRVAGSRVATHGLHYPARELWHGFETARLRGVTELFALTQAGQRSITATTAVPSTLLPHYIPERSTSIRPDLRPPGIGIFGQRYGGKGYDLVPSIRDVLPDDISLSVAGRGTEHLQTVRGVQYWGSVDGLRERAFFESNRVIVLPYTESSRYGTIMSASGVVARAHAYGTPVVATAVRAFPSEADGHALRVAPSVSELVRLAAWLVGDREALIEASRRVERIRLEHSLPAVAAKHIARWRELMRVD